MTEEGSKGIVNIFGEVLKGLNPVCELASF